MMNSIKRTIDGVEKTPTEYKFHLDGDIFAIVNVFKTYRFVHIRHYRDETYPEMDNFRMPVNVFLDLSKAFDTLDHEILLSKLKFYGVCDSGNNLFRSYLSNRFQFVDLNGSKSSLKKYIQVCSKVLFWVLYCF